jgi:hypothetical protein
LPAKLKAGQRKSFSFTVTNNQGRAEKYSYTVTLTQGKKRQVIGKGSLAVDDSQSSAQIVEVKPTVPKSQFLVKVSLNGTGDVIQFYGETS